MDDFSILDSLEKNLTYKRIGIEEFAESPKFCNKPLYPKQRLLLKLMFLEELTDREEAWLDEWIKSKEVRISPDIRERVQWCREHSYPHFREVVLVGGRRSSKGFLTGLALGKKMYDTLQLQDPNAHYGIDANKEIYFTCVAASEKQAKELQYSDLSNTVNSCAAIRPYIYKSQELEFSIETEKDRRTREMILREGRGSRQQRDISTLRGRALASNSRTIRGYTSMGIVFDEMAFFQQGESDAADEAVYEAAIPSLGQFSQDGMLFCNSSPWTKVGKFNERFEVSQATDNGKPVAPMVMGIQFPSWALFEDWWEDPDYAGPRKSITVSPDWDPERKDEFGNYYYVHEDRNSIEVERAREQDNPDTFKVERRAQWAEVVDAYLNPDMVDRMFLGRPLETGGFEPFTSNRDDSSYVYRYKAHLDPSSTTAGFGFALGHTEVFELLDKEGIPQKAEHVVFDIIKRWRPQDFPQRVIDWELVIKEVMFYADIFRPYEITFDQFQSAAPIQDMNRRLLDKGMSDIRVYEKTATAAHNYKRAEVFKTALYQGYIHAPEDCAVPKGVNEELKYLQEIRTGRTPRIDKQDIGPVTTKDMADCAMEVVESLIGNVIASQVRQDISMPPSFGAMGGYPIGGHDRGGMGQAPSPFADLYTRRIGEQAGPGTAMSGTRAPRGSNRAPGSPARGRRFGR